MPTYPQKCVFGPIFDFPRVPKSTLGASFSAKKAPKVEYPSLRCGSGGSSGPDLGAIWRRKRSKEPFSSIRGRFGWILNTILERYWPFFYVLHFMCENSHNRKYCLSLGRSLRPLGPGILNNSILIFVLGFSINHQHNF